MNTKTIKFDLNKYKLYEKIKAKQGDTKSRFLLFQLLDGSIPFNLKNRSVRAYMIKPDGKEIFNDLIVNNYDLGYCTLELTNQALAVQGTVKIELMVTEEDKKLTSSVFELEVVKSINSEKSIVSTNEFTALLNGLAALSEYDNYKNSVKEMEINKANKAEVEKKFTSVEEKIKNNSEQLDKIIQKTNKILSIEDLLRDISNRNIYKIRWIGDSISVGYDSTGAEPNPDGEIIFNYGGDVHKAPKEDSIGYVNRLRLTLKSFNSSIKLINASMSGRSVKEAYRMKEGYYLSDRQHDHVIFIALGINDLHMCANIQEFKTTYDGLIKYFKTIADKVICVTPTPVLREHLYTSENGTPVNLKVKDVCIAIKEMANNNECYVLDLNTEIMKMVDCGLININDFYKDDVLHPSDNGHTIIFKALCNLLGIKLNDDLFLISTANYKELELQNNWVNASFDSSDLKFGCMFIGKNRVRIKGILKDGITTNGTIITTLPSIYSPSKKQYFNVNFNDGTGVKCGVLTLSTNGDLAILGDIGSSWLNIDIEILLN